MIETKRQPFVKYFVQRTKSNWVLFAIMAAYLAFCIGSFIYFVTINDLRNYCACLIGMLLIPVFYTAEWTMRIKVPMIYVLILVVFMFGNVAGAGYNLYTIIPCFDDILHVMWGIVFMVLGIAVIQTLMGEPKTVKAYFTYLLFGLSLAALSALLWEILEFTLDSVTGNFDMQEDDYVNSIGSYLLWPTFDHLNVFHIDGIDHTILYDADGNVIYTFEQGYLDIGLLDTMWDIIWCMVACCVLFVLLTLDRFFFKGWVYRYLIPESTVEYVEEEGQEAKE